MSLLDRPAELRTNISVSAIAECAFSIAEDYAVDYLRRAESGGDEAAIRVPLAVPSAIVQHRVKMRFGIHLDVLEEGRRHDEVRLRWTSGSRWLPDFHGTLRFRIEGQRTRIRIDGHYRPPFGRLGQLFDRVFGETIARLSLQDLANKIAADLGERERIWRSRVSSPAQSERRC